MTLWRALAQRFARLTTDAVVGRPALWRLFRAPLTFQFDRLAERWNTITQPDHLASLEAALGALGAVPRHVLDLGTGTGAAAAAVASRWPDAEVVGVDLSRRMVEEARRSLAPELRGRVRFEVADAARLPFAAGAFDLVVLANMIPFFDELTRVVAPGGTAMFVFSGGSETPIYVPPDRLERELGVRGFERFERFEAGRGTALLARRGSRGTLG